MTTMNRVNLTRKEVDILMVVLSKFKTADKLKTKGHIETDREYGNRVAYERCPNCND